MSTKLIKSMCSGIEFVNKIDSVLKDSNKTRKELAEKLNIIPATMATWKTKDIMPPVDTIQRIADELMVSIDWLVNGDIDFENNETYLREWSRKSVRRRIYIALGNKYKDDDKRFAEGYLDNEPLLKELHKYYFGGGYVLYEELYNWAKGRRELDQKLFHQWAQNLNTTLQFIITGGDILIPSSDKYSKPFEKDLYDLALDFRNELYCLHCYSPERLKRAKELLNEFMKLEHLEYVEKNKKDPQ